MPAFAFSCSTPQRRSPSWTQAGILRRNQTVSLGKETVMKYRLENTGGSKIAAALAKACAPDGLGAHLITEGFNQHGVAKFAAALAVYHISNGKTEAQLLAIFNMTSVANTSALRQALEKLDIYGTPFNAHDKEGKEQPVAVEQFWKLNGSKKPAADLSLLD